MSRPPQLDDLWAIPFAPDPQLSPDGGSIAFVPATSNREADTPRTTLGDA